MRSLNKFSLPTGNHLRSDEQYDISNFEKEKQYPGEIKISVIRETRVIDYAR